MSNDLNFKQSVDGFNDRNPFRLNKQNPNVVIGGDNIVFSRQRWQATKAVIDGTATPEQHALVMEAQQKINEAMSGEGEE